MKTTQAQLKEIFKSDANYTEAAETLNKAGYTTKQGKQWTQWTLAYALRSIGCQKFTKGKTKKVAKVATEPSDKKALRDLVIESNMTKQQKLAMLEHPL